MKYIQSGSEVCVGLISQKRHWTASHTWAGICSPDLWDTLLVFRSAAGRRDGTGKCPSPTPPGLWDHRLPPGLGDTIADTPAPFPGLCRGPADKEVCSLGSQQFHHLARLPTRPAKPFSQEVLPRSNHGPCLCCEHSFSLLGSSVQTEKNCSLLTPHDLRTPAAFFPER